MKLPGNQYERLIYAFGYTPTKKYRSKREWDEAKIRARMEFFRTQGRKQIDGLILSARWRNPDNANPAHSNWKTTDDPGQSLEDFYTTLHGARGALRQAEEDTRKEWLHLVSSGPIQREDTKPKRLRKKVPGVAKRKRKS